MSAFFLQLRKLPLTAKILLAMVLGSVVGLGINLTIPDLRAMDAQWVNNLVQTFEVGGKIFIRLIKMLVVPIVFVSLVCGTCHLRGTRELGRLGLKTLLLYLFTTALAISLGLIIAAGLHIGSGANLALPGTITIQQAPTFKRILLDIFPVNPLTAMTEGNMLQIIVFSLLLGVAISLAGEKGKGIATLFDNFNEVFMKLMHIILLVAPYGVFFLIASMFARVGFDLIHQLLGYFLTVMLVLVIHLTVSYSAILLLLARLNPIQFFKNMYPAMIFAFSTSSSSASIPVTLNTVMKRCGVKQGVAAFVIPLGATINMDGTAIMQGIATVFIANIYQVDLSFTAYLTIILTATLASIGTAGVPSVGLITLSMVLQQAGVPMEGIGLIIGVDRLLDMTRTAVNIAGDSMVACVVGKSEREFDQHTYDALPDIG